MFVFVEEMKILYDIRGLTEQSADRIIRSRINKFNSILKELFKKLIKAFLISGLCNIDQDVS